MRTPKWIGSTHLLKIKMCIFYWRLSQVATCKRRFNASALSHSLWAWCSLFTFNINGNKWVLHDNFTDFYFILFSFAFTISKAKTSQHNTNTIYIFNGKMCSTDPLFRQDTHNNDRYDCQRDWSYISVRMQYSFYLFRFLYCQHTRKRISLLEWHANLLRLLRAIVAFVVG